MAEIQFDDQVDITDKVCPLTFEMCIRDRYQIMLLSM